MYAGSVKSPSQVPRVIIGLYPTAQPVKSPTLPHESSNLVSLF